MYIKIPEKEKRELMNQKKGIGIMDISFHISPMGAVFRKASASSL